MQRIAIILAYLLICANCLAQKYPFVHYTPREGLVNNKARSVFQDSKGRLYITTFGGLSIYDGTRFINYTSKTGLASYFVNDIVEMAGDSIWILPNSNKVHCMVNGRLKDFIPSDTFTPLINQMIKCSDGFYYALADEGLFRLENRRFINIPINGLPAGTVAKTFLSAVEVGKKLFIVSNPYYRLNGGSLLVYDLLQKKLVGYNHDFHVGHLFTPGGNELWLTTPAGLLQVDKIGSNGEPVTVIPVSDAYHIPKELRPHFIYRDRQFNLWLTSGEGVYRINKDGKATLFTTANGLTTNFQSSIFQDRENNMWFTNEQTGLCKLSNQQLAYYPEFMPGFYTTDIFIAPTTDSVWLYDAYHHQILLQLPNGQVRKFSNDQSFITHGRMIIGKEKYFLSGNKIYSWRILPNTGRYELSIRFNDSANVFGFNSGMVEKNGNIVTASNKLALVTKEKVVIEPLDYMIDQLTIDPQNRVWVASRSNRLFCFEISGSGNDLQLSLLRKYENVVKSSPRSLTADKSGNIWIGTRDEGLFCLEFDGLNIKKMIQASMQQGMSENFVNYLFCDKENNIWACTPSGLDKLKKVNDHFLIENITRSNNLYFPTVKVQQTKEGMFWIVTEAGVITYDPVRQGTNNWKPALIFSDVVIDDTGRMSIPINRRLLHNQNNLTFQLSAPTYIDEKQTRFSYLLEGSGNKNWSSPSSDASINFVNLPPGEYILRAKAIFLHGLYPDIESSYAFTILPPWWQTWWFKLLVGIFILSLILLGLRFYINRKLQLQRVVLEKRRAVEQERTRIATDMHDDLGAGLSQIKFLSETIGMRKQKHLPIEEEIDSIRTFSHEMIDKMGEIVWALNEKNDTLSDLLSYTRSYAVEYLQQNGIRCKVEEPEHLPQHYVSSEFRRNIYLTVKESLHNIVKHAQANEVVINIEITDFLCIEIWDNGKGIDDPSVRSTGNGLTNMRNRIQGLKGRFKIINNNGTKVTIAVPMAT
jgi:signal transduction histidine kinase/ligand-binding sensor domain-containing protein